MVFQDRRYFWREAFAWQGSVTPLVIPYVLAFGLIATAICVLEWLEERLYHVKIGLEIAPFEIAGAALGLLLILRTNAGYDRWWEARKLWGGIVNQSRNLVISALSYGPADPGWRERFVKWAASSLMWHDAICEGSYHHQKSLNWWDRMVQPKLRHQPTCRASWP